jgi:hypothetical protein
VSWLTCERCRNYIDTDYDGECWVKYENGVEWTLCEGCRDDLEFNDDGLAVEPD